MENTDSILSDIETPEIEASYFVRLLANLIDGIIEIGVLLIIYFLLRETIASLFKTTPFAIYIMVFSIMITYRLACIFIYEKTIGMMIFKIKYLNSNQLPLSKKEKLVAVLAVRTSNIKIYKRNYT